MSYCVQLNISFLNIAGSTEDMNLTNLPACPFSQNFPFWICWQRHENPISGDSKQEPPFRQGFGSQLPIIIRTYTDIIWRSTFLKNKKDHCNASVIIENIAYRKTILHRPFHCNLGGSYMKIRFPLLYKNRHFDMENYHRELQ